jgi:PBP1b-binding outer membrane lipoprotein LpoB
MKKLACVLALTLFLTACGETKTVENVEFIQQIKINQQTVIQFKDPSGNLYNFFTRDESMIYLSKGTKYNVSAFIGDNLSDPNYIAKIELVK